MEVKYRIIDVDPNQHSIIVRYYTNVLTEDSLAISFNTDGSIARRADGSPQRCQTDYHINIWKTDTAPTAEEIQKIANDAAPYDWFKLKHDILDPNIDTSLSNASSLVGKEFAAVKPVILIESLISSNTSANTAPEELIENEIQRIIDSITANTSNT